MTWLAIAAILVAVLNLVIRDLSQERDKHVESVVFFTMTLIATIAVIALKVAGVLLMARSLIQKRPSTCFFQ